MSYRLRKKWENDPKGAALECCIYHVVFAGVVLAYLTDLFKIVPSIWQLAILIGALILVIGLTILTAIILRKYFK